jgi:hypothetical protein
VSFARRATIGAPEATFSLAHRSIHVRRQHNGDAGLLLGPTWPQLYPQSALGFLPFRSAFPRALRYGSHMIPKTPMGP